MDVRLRQSGFLRQTLVSNQPVGPEIHHDYFEFVACCFHAAGQFHSRGFCQTTPRSRPLRRTAATSCNSPRSSNSLASFLGFFIKSNFRSEEHTSELQSLRHLVC